ncbi:MAG TPA: hypothetical protein VGB94_02520 [Acidobacteriaceae bacterium]
MASSNVQSGNTTIRDSSVILLAAFVVVLPLLLRGASCGHDLDFHMTNWLEVSEQWWHGIIWPRWAFTPAWGAGEPRFVFYPPLSWLLGGLLSLALPIHFVPATFTFVSLTLSGFTMRRLASEWTTPHSALVAAVFYLANPYMLFVVYERCAYGELLATAWMPLLLLAVLRDTLSIRRIAVATALVWLTNIPSAVMSTYLFALLLLLRLIFVYRSAFSGRRIAAMVQLLLPAASGMLLGLGLAAFYLLPVAWERHWIHVELAMPPGMRPQDNTLFHHTPDFFHDRVLWTASHLALLMMAIAVVFLLAAWQRRTHADRRLIAVLGSTVFAIGFALTPASLFAWRLPELQYLQFPWRLLALLGVLCSVLLALALRSRRNLLLIAAILLPFVLVPPAWHQFHVPSMYDDQPSAQFAYFRSGYGVAPFDEYTPRTANTAALQDSVNPYWITDDPQSLSRHPSSANGSIDFSTRQSFHVAAPHAAFLVIRLRNYPGWQVRVNGAVPTLVQRPDGYFAIALPAGEATITVRYRIMPDAVIGLLISLIALILCFFLQRRSRHGGMNPLSIPVPQAAPFLPGALPT